MKVLLIAVNAKYIHSNLAVYSLKAYAEKYKETYKEQVELAEFTINQYSDYILREIYKKKPDVAAFSCYIWNIEMVEKVAEELHKILPETKIWLGGPEVSYDAEEKLKASDYIDGIMIGEGEETFLELLEHYIEKSRELEDIRGLFFRQRAKAKCQPRISCRDAQITKTPVREQMELSSIPFPYENLNEFKNKIIYYETSRGCPYSCSYCLSSIDKRVRFRRMDLVKKELQIFLDNQISQVKFVDRTFNCNKEHAMEIWNYIRDHDNGITNFHFEISADILGEDELYLFSDLRDGLVQLEIGVQSVNPLTINAIHRRMDFDKLRFAVNRIRSFRNINQHLDLIAGLPFEDYKLFQHSFNEVYALRPEQFQLGFLKVLKGSAMYDESNQRGIIYKSSPPYEVLCTQWLDYSQVLQLKSVEEMVEIYYNSGQFCNTVKYLEHFHKTPFDMYQNLGDYYEETQLAEMSHSRINRYQILLEYFQSRICREDSALREIMLYDLYLRENLKSRPSFANDNSNYKEQCRRFYEDEIKRKECFSGYEDCQCRKIGKMIHIEHFDIDIEKTVETGIRHENECFVLYDYQKRNPLTYEAAAYCFKL